MNPEQQNPSNHPRDDMNDEQNTIRSAGPGNRPGKNRPGQKDEKTMRTQSNPAPVRDEDDSEELNQTSDKR